MNNNKNLANNKVTYQEYLILRDKAIKLGLLLRNMHSSNGAVKMQQEYNFLKQKLENVEIIRENQKSR